MAFLGSCIVYLFFVVFSGSPMFWSLLFLFSFFYTLDLGKWVDGFISQNRVSGLLLGNALADMYVKCEVVNTSLVCFPGETNVGGIAEKLRWVTLC